MSSCPPESNKGLPIILQGPISQVQLKSIKTPSFIELKPTARTTFPSFDTGFIFNEQSTTTIRSAGENFALTHLQIFRPFHGTSYFAPRTPVGEFTAWFKSSNKILLASIPIYIAPTNNLGGKYLAAALNKDTAYKGSIGDIFGKQSIQYETCIQTGTNKNNLKGLPINVLVFLNGIEIDAATQKKFQQQGGGALTVFGFPAILLPDLENKTVEIPQPQLQLDMSTNALRKVYSTIISTGNDNFQSRFRYYENTFLLSVQEQKKKNASAYKCIPLDAKKNLKMVNGKLIINLEDDEIAGAGTLEDVANQQNVKDSPQSNVSQAATYVAITIGSITGIALASGVLWLGFRVILRKPN